MVLLIPFFLNNILNINIMTISRIIGFIISVSILLAICIMNWSCSYSYGKGCGGQAKPIYHYKHKAI